MDILLVEHVDTEWRPVLNAEDSLLAELMILKIFLQITDDEIKKTKGVSFSFHKTASQQTKT